MKKKTEPSLVIKSDDQQIVYGEVVPGYWVSSDGQVWSLRPVNGRGPLLSWEQRRELKQSVQDNGYYTVVIDRQTKAVHALVLETFVGPANGKQCRHLNRDKSNNRLTNLAWGTGVDQANDREKHGTKLKGSKVGTAKLTEAQVLEARSLTQIMSYQTLAKKFGVSRSTIAHAVSPTGNNWRHL